MAQIALSDLVVGEVIGSGAYGEVKKAWLPDSPETQFALKIFRPFLGEGDERDKFVADIRQGLQVYANLRYPAFRPLLAWSEEGGQLRILWPFAQYSLEQALSEVDKGTPIAGWNDTVRSCIAIGIAAAGSYFHSHNIVYRDLKPSKIFLDRDLRPLLGIDQLSLVVSGPREVPNETMGTPLYMAPDFDGDEDVLTTAIDVFSYAITLYRLVTQSNELYPGIKSHLQLHRKVVQGVRPELPNTVPQPYAELIKKCWAGDPTQRPTFAAIVDLPVESWSFPETDVGAVNAYRQVLIDALSG
jgi:serine/threonine protein kinase